MRTVRGVQAASAKGPCGQREKTWTSVLSCKELKPANPLGKARERPSAEAPKGAQPHWFRPWQTPQDPGEPGCPQACGLETRGAVGAAVLDRQGDSLWQRQKLRWSEG